MRRVLLLLFAFASAGLLVSAAVAGGPNCKAKLRVVSASPLTIKGTGFKRNELVRISVAAGDVQTARRVRTSRSGTFSATFGAVSIDRCNGGLEISARGSRGSMASVDDGKLPMLQCAPSLTP